MFADKDTGKEEPLSLLVGTQAGIAVTESNMEVFPKTEKQNYDMTQIYHSWTCTQTPYSTTDTYTFRFITGLFTIVKMESA